MKRKLFSVVLCAFALLLLMGAAAVPKEPAATILAEEESSVSNETALETDAQTLDAGFARSVIAASGLDPLEVAEDAESMEATVDNSLLIDGQPAPLGLGKRLQNDTTYVSLSAMAQVLDPTAQIGWDGETMTVTTQGLSLTAHVGAIFLSANGRYLYIPEGVQFTEDFDVSVPLRTVAKAFDAAVGYDGVNGTITITRGTGAILPGDSFYDQNDLFWLSRVIQRESGNQSLEGQMSVGSVVLNRVADPIFPDTVEGVLAQKNQFTTYASGVLAATEPTQSSTIAAKLVMDGGEVEETRGALFFDSSVNSWASKHKEHIATLGDHKFYR